MSYLTLAYPLIGLCGGFLAGLLGIGGGLVIVPALLWVLPYQGMAAAGITHAAVATSLATVIATSLVATYAHHRHQAVEWPIFWKMAPGLLAGALAGAMLATGISGDLLKTLFGMFALVVALQMGLRLQLSRQGRLPTAPGLMMAGTFIGMISAILGVGGGTLTVPFLNWGKVLMRRAVATSSACGFPIAVGGSLGFDLLAKGSIPVDIYWPAALWIAAASIIATPLGVKCAHGISTALLTRVFAAILAVISIRLIWH